MKERSGVLTSVHAGLLVFWCASIVVYYVYNALIINILLNPTTTMCVPFFPCSLAFRDV
jgi:hypothetical protein